MAQRGSIVKEGRYEAQRRHFPDRRLDRLIEIADGLRSRPTFDEARSYLESLFIDLLRYERDGADVTSRTDLAPSAKSSQVRSLATLRGLRVYLVERQAASFRPSDYGKIFRTHQDSLVFVHSARDNRVRVALWPREGHRTYRYRSLTPREVIGPRSDRWSPEPVFALGTTGEARSD